MTYSAHSNFLLTVPMNSFWPLSHLVEATLLTRHIHLFIHIHYKYLFISIAHFCYLEIPGFTSLSQPIFKHYQFHKYLLNLLHVTIPDLTCELLQHLTSVSLTLSGSHTSITYTVSFVKQRQFTGNSYWLASHSLPCIRKGKREWSKNICSDSTPKYFLCLCPMQIIQVSSAERPSLFWESLEVWMNSLNGGGKRTKWSGTSCWGRQKYPE